MRFTCPKCDARYNVADDKLPAADKLRLTCKKCGTAIRVRRKAPIPAATAREPEFGGSTKVANLAEINAVKRRSRMDSEPTEPTEPTQPTQPTQPQAVEANDEWFLLIAGGQKGPFSAAQVEEKLLGRKVGRRTYAWQEGMGDWARLGSLDPFRDLAASMAQPARRPTPPPPPVAAAEPVTLSPATPAETEPDFSEFHQAVLLDAVENTPVVLEPITLEAPPRAAIAEATPFCETPVELPPVAAEPQFNTQELGDALSNAAVGFFHDPTVAPNQEYVEAPPGESTQVFLATAGVYRRRRIQKYSAIGGGVFAVLLIALVVLDITGAIKLPGMGKVYDMTGLQDPNQQRSEERTTRKVVKSDLTDEKRQRLRDKMLGTSKGGAATSARKKAGKGKARAAKTVGISDEKTLSDKQRDMAASIFDDSRRKERKVKMAAPTKIQTPNLPQGLTHEAIFEVINENSRSMSLCIAQAHKAGERLEGKMEVELTIEADGKVTEARIATAKFRGSTIGGCTVKTVRRWRFPRFNGEPVTVAFPYVLSVAF